MQISLHSKYRNLGQELYKAALIRNAPSLMAFGLPFCLYLLTLAPTIYNLDSAELTTAAATLGITRPTGYPLYTLLGHLFSRLPLGDVGYRLNLFSAFNAALTIALTERIMRRLKLRSWVTLVALGILCTSTYFWAMALIAEVYTLQTALMAALVLAMLRWADQADDKRAGLIGLLLGLSLCNHLSTVLLLPGIALFIIWTGCNQRLSLSQGVAASTGLFLGLSLYLYLPFRAQMEPAFNYAGTYDAQGRFHSLDLSSLPVFTWFLSGGSFKSLMFSIGGEALREEIVRFLHYLWAAFLGVGLGPGVVGLVVMIRRRFQLGAMLTLMFLLHAAFYIPYEVLDKPTMLLPNLWIWSLWFAVGLDWMMAYVRDEGDDSALISRFGEGALRAAGLVLVTMLLIRNWPLVDLARDQSTRQLGEEIMAQIAPDALVIASWDTAPVLEYLQLVEGQRTDIQVINRFLISDDAYWALVGHEVTERPVYVDECSTNLRVGVRADPSGDLFRLTAVYP